MLSRLLRLLLVLAAAAGCSADTSDLQRLSEPAGELVEVPASALEDLPEWQFFSEPALRIGTGRVSAPPVKAPIRRTPLLTLVPGAGVEPAHPRWGRGF